MGRETSPHIIGQFWLDRRPDGKSDAWQIAWYDGKARTVRYRSTRCKGLSDAVAAIDAHYAASKARGRQDASAALVPQLLLYWDEHGQHAVSPEQIASSLRVFIAFLMQDEIGLDLTFADVTPALFRRFTSWRMGPHSHALDWKGRHYARRSGTGVRGETVQRNLDDVRAALNHAANEGRVPYAPKVPSVEARHRSPPRSRVLSAAELARIIGYAMDDPPLLRFVLAQIATMARPEAVRAWRPWQQADMTTGVFDTHPPGAPRTKKRNPTLPIPIWWRDWLAEWIASGDMLPVQMRSRWATMRRALGLGADVEAKTIRRTMATWFAASGVPQTEIEMMLGHRATGATGHYIHVRAEHLQHVRTTSDLIWLRLMFLVRSWRADHLRTIPARGAPILIVGR